MTPKEAHILIAFHARYAPHQQNKVDRLLDILEGGEPEAIFANREALIMAFRRLIAESNSLEEVHNRLDSGGVPEAQGAACDDPMCQTRGGHRVKMLIAERDRLRATVANKEAALEAYRIAYEVRDEAK